LLLPTFDLIKKSRKEKGKTEKIIQNTRGYLRRKPIRLPKLVVKDQNDKWKSLRTKMYKISKIGNQILIKDCPS
jgi:hypothetical protein